MGKVVCLVKTLVRRLYSKSHCCSPTYVPGRDLRMLLQDMCVVKTGHRGRSIRASWGDYGIVIGEKVYFCDQVKNVCQFDKDLNLFGRKGPYTIEEIYSPASFDQFVHANWKLDTRSSSNQIDLDPLNLIWSRYKD